MNNLGQNKPRRKRLRYLGNGISAAAPATAAASSAIVGPPLRHWAGATAFCLFSAVVYFLWMVVPFLNTQYTDGIPQLGIPLPANQTQKYLSARYGWDWVHVLLLAFNALLPMTLAWAMTNNRIEAYSRLHRWLSMLFLIINLWVLAVLSWRWFWTCNNSYSGMQSACNDYRWCCVYFPSEWCPNVNVCGYDVPADMTSGQLARNAEMTYHWIAGFVFFIMAAWHTSINRDMREFGVLH